MSDADLALEVERSKALADADYWRFSRSSSRSARPGGPGTERYARATRERRRRLHERHTRPCPACAELSCRDEDRVQRGIEAGAFTLDGHYLSCRVCGDSERVAA